MSYRKKSPAAVATKPSSHSSAEVEEDPADLLPTSNPVGLLSVAVKQLAQDDDWCVLCLLLFCAYVTWDLPNPCTFKEFYRLFSLWIYVHKCVL